MFCYLFLSFIISDFFFLSSPCLHELTNLMPVSVSETVLFLICQIRFTFWLRITWLSSVTRLHAFHASDGLFLPTERPPLVGEFSANFLRIEGVAWSAQRIPTAVNLGFLDRSRRLRTESHGVCLFCLFDGLYLGCCQYLRMHSGR
jgi:hypothetical protein